MIEEKLISGERRVILKSKAGPGDRYGNVTKIPISIKLDTLVYSNRADRSDVNGQVFNPSFWERVHIWAKKLKPNWGLDHVVRAKHKQEFVAEVGGKVGGVPMPNLWLFPLQVGPHRNTVLFIKAP